jgi:hypothetical protein
MFRTLPYILMVAGVIALSGPSFAQSAPPAPMSSAGAGAGAGAGAVTVPLSAQNGSGETGSVTLTQAGNTVVVVAHTVGGGSAAQPIHIHIGTCAKLDPAPKYPLTTLQNGTSNTTLNNMKLSDLETGNYAINVHKSTADIGTYVACGNISKAGTT